MRTGIVCFIYCCINFWHSTWHSTHFCWMEPRSSNGETGKWEGLRVAGSKCHAEASKCASHSLFPKPPVHSSAAAIFFTALVRPLFSHPVPHSLPPGGPRRCCVHLHVLGNQHRASYEWGEYQPALARLHHIGEWHPNLRSGFFHAYIKATARVAGFPGQPPPYCGQVYETVTPMSVHASKLSTAGKERDWKI